VCLFLIVAIASVALPLMPSICALLSVVNNPSEVNVPCTLALPKDVNVPVSILPVSSIGILSGDLQGCTYQY
jgi:hypothetical protein